MLEQSLPIIDGIRQDDTSFVHVPGRGAYPRSSWLSHAIENCPLRIWLEQFERWDYIPRSFTIPEGNHMTTLDVVSLDIGNRSAKLCAQNAAHQLVTMEIPAVLQSAPTNSASGLGHEYGLARPDRRESGGSVGGRRGDGWWTWLSGGKHGRTLS